MTREQMIDGSLEKLQTSLVAGRLLLKGQITHGGCSIEDADEMYNDQADNLSDLMDAVVRMIIED